LPQPRDFEFSALGTIIDRLNRSLSVFNMTSRRWSPQPSQIVHSEVSRRLPTPLNGSQTLFLVLWNVDAFSLQHVSRTIFILGYVLEGLGPVDIVCLREVMSDVRAALLADARARTVLLATDAEDPIRFQGAPFATMVLLSRAHFVYRRDAHEEGRASRQDESLC
jgi:hypothetical protein